MASLLKVTFNDNIAEVSLNRPELKNAINVEMLNQIQETFVELNKNEKIEIIILTGYSSPNFVFFSSGIDLNELKQLKEQAKDIVQFEQLISSLQESVASIEFTNKIVFAVVHGFCYGAALELALACDFIISTPETKLGLFETKFGIIPDFGGSYRLLRRVGYQHAKRLIMFSEEILGVEALSIGLVDWVTNLLDLDKTKTKIIEKLLANDKDAILQAKRLIRKLFPLTHEEGSKEERNAQIQLMKKLSQT